MITRSILAAIAAWSVLAQPASAQGAEKLSIVVFGAPSLGAFLPPIIKAQKLDEKNGLSITFEERTPDAYTAQFNSGEFQLGGSAVVADGRSCRPARRQGHAICSTCSITGARWSHRGPRSSRSKDLEGKDLAAAKGTTNYVMFDWFARQLGADTSKFSVVNTATPGLVGYAMADRATAVQLWEPAYTTLLAKKPGISTIDLKIADSWQKVDRQQEHPLSRRRRASRLGREAQGC